MQRSTEMYAGLALFFSMYYVLETNPAILKDIGVPASAALLGTFLAVIIGNLRGSFVTRTGLMIAPAIGISAFVKNYVQQSDGNLDWRHAMLACAIAGFLVLLTSKFTDWRERIVTDMPESVRKGATAGIGALLVKEGFDLFKNATEKLGLAPKWAGIAVTLSVVLLVMFFLIRSKVEEKTLHPALRFVMQLEFLLVVVLMAIFLNVFQPDYIAALPSSSDLSYLWNAPNVWVNWKFNFVSVILITLFAATIWFIVISDIPGTPNVVLPAELTEIKDGKRPEDGERAVRGGYVNDGWFAFLSPVFGTTPTIYYAENQILKSFGVYSRAVGLWATGLFALVFLLILLGQFVPSMKIPLHKFLSPIAILPILIFIGLYMIAVSYFDEKKKAETKTLDAAAAAAAAPQLTPQYFIPTAILAILTSRIGLEYSLPLAMLSFWLVKSKTDTYGPTFVAISIGSGISLVVFGLIFLFGTT